MLENAGTHDYNQANITLTKLTRMSIFSFEMQMRLIHTKLFLAYVELRESAIAKVLQHTSRTSTTYYNTVDITLTKLTLMCI